MSLCLRHKTLQERSVAPSTSSTYACASRKYAESPTRTSAGKTCTTRTKARHGLTGFVPLPLHPSVPPTALTFHSIKTTPMSVLVVSVAILNTFYLFTRTRTYQLSLASEPVSSPHASFVKRPPGFARDPNAPGSDDQDPFASPSFSSLARSFFGSVLRTLWRFLVASVRFLLNLSPPRTRPSQPWEEDERVQTLEVWTPGPLEMGLFAIYSPVHALLWMATTSANWILTIFVMFIVGVQVRAPTVFEPAAGLMQCPKNACACYFSCRAAL